MFRRLCFVVTVLALPASGAAAVGGLQVVAVDEGLPVPDASLILSRVGQPSVTDEVQTDNLGVGLVPLDEGRYTLEVRASSRSVTGSVDIEAGMLVSYTADLGAGSLNRNEAALDQYRPLTGVATARGYDVAFADLDGVLSVRIALEPGMIFLGIPARAVVEQTISWSAVLLPYAQTEPEQAEGRARLAQHTVRIGEERFSLDGVTSWTMAARQTIDIELLAPSARDPVVALTLNLNTRTEAGSVVEKRDGIVAHAGWPVRIPGTFDGLAENTEVTFAGEPANVVAETSVAVYFSPPNGPFGMQSVRITDGSGATVTVTIRSVGLEVWAEDLDLWTGEQTPLHVRLYGLQDLAGPAYLSVINATIPIVTMSQGNFQFFVIPPGEIDGSGTVAIQRTLTGIQRGIFEINARMTLR